MMMLSSKSHFLICPMTTPSIKYHIYLDPSVYYCMITINSVSNVWDVVINVVWDVVINDSKKRDNVMIISGNCPYFRQLQ